MARKSELPPQERIAKAVKAIYFDLKEIDSREQYNDNFRNWFKREYERIQWRHPELLK